MNDNIKKKKILEKKAALVEMEENIKSSFSLQKNFLKITSPPYLSSTVEKY